VARRFIFNLFTFVVVWHGTFTFFFPGILHELKNSYRRVFRFILMIRKIEN